MSRFFSSRYSTLVPYVPGEQPADVSKYIKLNTNESPFPLSEKALRYAEENARAYNLYNDPDASGLCALYANTVGLDKDEVLAGNGSDSILNYAFMAFCEDGRPALFPDVTYGFYSVIADLNAVPFERIALNDDLTVNAEDYMSRPGTSVIANPNAPTGIALKPADIAKIAEAKPDDLLIVDEAYVDFGAESCIPLIKRYDNVLVVQTFSKSRSMAGARLGFAAGNRELIKDLNTLKYSNDPYNVNSYTQALGAGMLLDRDYTAECWKNIINNREYLVEGLKKLGFELTDSKANFVFARHPGISGLKLYEELKARNILVRHFEAPRIRDYNRITVGTREQLDKLMNTAAEILAARL